MLITFAATMTPLPGQGSLRDVLYATSGALAGASLFAFIPAIAMWSDSGSKVEIEPATPSDDGSATPVPAPRRFSRAAAAATLGRAIDKARAECRTDDGITGPGHVKLTFEPSGEVSSVEVEPPYAGTPTGDCVEKSLRRANVPAFDGAAVTVGKSFTIGE